MPITRPESEACSQQDWRDYTDRTPLEFRWSHSPIRTIELDLDSLHRAGFGAGWGFVDSPLRRYAAENKDVTATIHVYETFSSNFMPACNSVFFGAIGRKKKGVLEVIESTLRAQHGVRVRPGEFIRFEECQRVRHIEEGRLWAPLEACTWYAEERRLEEDGEDEKNEEVAIPENAQDNQGRPRRRRVRGDAKVGTVIRSIETERGLPAGSVVLQGPDRKRLRADARISTLRRRWEED